MPPHIEQLAPELEKILSPSQPIEHLAEGFGGGIYLDDSTLAMKTTTFSGDFALTAGNNILIAP